MKSTRKTVVDRNGVSIPGSRALLWGNNGSWLCVADDCGELLGTRTGDTEVTVRCPSCGTGYELLRGLNKNGGLNLGPAAGVRLL